MWTAIIAAITTALAAVASGYSQKQQSKAQQTANDTNAKILEQNAVQKRLETSLNEDNVRRQNRLKMASSRAAMAENGIIESPTAMYALGQESSDLEHNALTARYTGQTEAADLLNRSNLEKFQGRVAARNGKNAFYMSLLTGTAQGTSTGMTTYYGLNRSYNGK